MEQRGDGRVISTLILLPLFIVFLSLFTAPVFAGTAFELTPMTLYEGTSHVFNFTITTSHLTKPIDEINLSADALNSLIVTNDSQFNQGWDAVLGASSILWKNNSIPKGSFVIYTYLQFSARLPQVSVDTGEQWQISTVDNKGVVTLNTLNVTIKNDATPPVLSNLNPAANGFLRSAASAVSVQAADPESGVASVGFNFSACGGNTTTTTTLGVAGTPDNYSASADFSSFSEGTPICFSFSSSSNGGEFSAAGGNFTIDNTPPVVTSISPADNTFVAAAPNLSFFANDSVSPSVSCTVLLDGIVVANSTPNHSTLVAVSVNASDGVHPWSVSCTDLAGNTGTSATRTVKVDTAPPTVSLNAVPLIIRGRQNMVSGTITDFSGVSKVDSHITLNATANQTVPTSSDGSVYTFTLAPESTTELGAYSFIVNAEDSIGHATSATVTYNVTYNYAVTLNAVSAASGADATLTGTVRMDNASLPKETGLTLVLPDGTSVLVPFNNQTGGFSYTIPAPATTGTYDIVAHLSSDNGITYNGSAALTVTASDPSGTAPGSGHGTRRGGVPSSGAGTGASGASSTAGSGASVSSASSTSTSSASPAGSASPPSSAASASAPASSDGATGIGRAGGFLTSALLKYSKLIWTIIVVALVIGVLVYISRGPEGPAVAVRTDSSTPSSFSSHPSLPSSSSPSSSSFSSSSPASSVFSPSFQQPIRESTTRHDLDLDEYLRSRLEK